MGRVSKNRVAETYGIEAELEKIRSQLQQRIRDLGYIHVQDFAKNSELADYIRPETVRRCINGGGYPTSDTTVVMVMMALNYKPTEIGAFLERAGGSYWTRLLKQHKLTQVDELWLKIINKVARAGSVEKLLSILELLDKAENISIAEIIEQLKKTAERHYDIQSA